MKKNTFDIELTFTNYKILKDANFQVKDFNVLLIEGPNETGKTSIRTMLREHWSAKAITEQPLTTDEEEGMTKSVIPDANGNNVTIIHNFNKFDRNGKFEAFDSDGTHIKSPGKIRELMGDIQTLTVAKLFALSENVPGRREIKNEILAQCLTDHQIGRIEEIDSDINPTSGIIFTKRRDTKRDLDNAKAKKEAANFNEEEKEILKNGTQAKEQLDEWDKEILNAVALRSELKKDIESRDESLLNLKDELKYNNENVDNLIEEAKKTIIAKEKELEDAKKVLTKWEKTKENIPGDEIFIQEREAELTERRKRHDAFDIEQMNKDKAEGQEYYEKYLALKTKEEAAKTVDEDIEKLEKQWKKWDDNIEELRINKASIFSNSKIPSGIEIRDDDIILNGYPMRETQVSESATALAFLELSCMISKGKFVDGGSAKVYGPSRMDKVVEIAERYNKLVVFEEVNEEIQELRLVTIIKE